MEVKELRDEVVPRLVRIEDMATATNGRVTKLEVFKVVATTIAAIGVFAIANLAAWIGLLN